jgi:predicted secreted acid phosphatase
MTDFAQRIRPDWATSLTAVLEQARTLGPRGVLAFDLDSTVFDNRTRQVRILSEYGRFKNLAPLIACQVDHWKSGWDLKGAMVAAGLSATLAEQLYKEAKAFWAERFFTSEYCLEDTEMEGAAAFLHASVATGAQVVYVTGRHEGMREGTVKCLIKCSMPVPGRTVSLLMKPTLKEDDDAYKRVAHQKLEEMGQLIAAFDNEPNHANDYAKRFPQATVVHLNTDHSGRTVELEPRIVTIPHFAMR